MPREIQDGIGAARHSLFLAPVRAPQGLERLAGSCLWAETDDSRLGDLSEKYVRAHERARASLGTAPWAMAAARLAADLAYLAATANVALFARVVDPTLRLAESGVATFVAFDLQERTMALLNAASRKLVVPALLLVGSAFLVSSAVDVWYTWQHAEALMARLQREKAEAAALQIEQLLSAVQNQIGWTATDPKWVALPVEQRRYDYVRLLRQVPAITEIAQINGEGKEVLRVSRLAMDRVDSGTDFADQVTFIEAQAQQKYFGPLYFRRNSEPYVTFAIASGRSKPDVTLAEVNLKKVWDTIRAIKLGETGYAYVVDGKGRLIAHPNIALVLSGRDLSALPQVAAALAAPTAGIPSQSRTFDTSLAGPAVLSVSAAVPTLGWRVFVELPTAEAYAPLWAALIRGVTLLVLGLVAALLASLVATRRARPAQPAHA